MLIFFPLFFSASLFNMQKFVTTIISFAVFCILASVIYIINDIIDVEKDRVHPVKKNRPLASGKISIKKAIFLLILLLLQFYSIY